MHHPKYPKMTRQLVMGIADQGTRNCIVMAQREASCRKLYWRRYWARSRRERVERGGGVRLQVIRARVAVLRSVEDYEYSS